MVAMVGSVYWVYIHLWACSQFSPPAPVLMIYSRVNGAVSHPVYYTLKLGGGDAGLDAACLKY